MNGTKIQLASSPNGDLTITTQDGTITVRTDGTITISTLGPVELTGETIGKFDGLPGTIFVQATNALRRRGKH